VKHSIYSSRICIMLAGLLMSGGVITGVSAAGTSSGTMVSNSATVNYQVGSIAQTPVTSAAATFVVDTRIDLSVVTVDTATVKVTPGSSDQVLTFTVTNTGNAIQDFSLSQLAVSSGTANTTDYNLDGNGDANDTFDASNIRIFVEDGTSPGFQAAQDTGSHIDELAADASTTVYIVVDIALAQASGDISSHHLVAEARAGGTASALGAALVEDLGIADNKDTVQVVFGDGSGSDANDNPGDAKYSSQDDYEVQSATVNVTKTSTVISDPFNTTNNPKRVPGAVVEYIITINNSTGVVDATNIKLTDLLDATNLTFLDSGIYSGNDIELNINSGTITTYTGTDADDDGGDFGVSVANTITVDYDAAGTGFTVPAGQSATLKFRVTIN